jgi:FHS family glucose/mannose:H+ symporter-like MFS transporter
VNNQSAAMLPGNEGRGRTATIVAYCIFATTGVGLVLPGALLSQLLARWSLNDQQAGLLFFIFFLGSSLGAALARGRLTRAIAAGTFCIAASSFTLSFASRVTCFFSIALMGIGLGTTMTSISLLRSRRRPEVRTSEMARLNLVWSLGACVGPALMLRGSAAWSLDRVLYAVGTVFVLATLATSLLIEEPAPAIASTQTSWRAQISRLPLLLLLIVPLSTGIESSTGSWLAAYSRRSGLMLGGTISTVSCFWAGLLVVRFVQSYRSVALASQRHAFRLGTWLAAVALLLLIFGPKTEHDNIVMPVSAFLVGVGLGPIYPLALSLILSCGEAGNIAFLIAGIGSSMLPLLTGVVSGRSGSLAMGLTVPLAGAIVMAAFSSLFSLRKTATLR